VVVIGFVRVEDERALDFEEEVEVDDVVDFDEMLEELLDFEDVTDVEEIGFDEVLEETLLVFDEETEVKEVVGFDAVEELVDLTDELEEVLFELELLVLDLLLDVEADLDVVELVDLALDVLEVTGGVAVHCPVDEGTALTPKPIATIFDPQFAA
jgi:hypothetical protein